jgi:hypothetical protein
VKINSIIALDHWYDQSRLPVLKYWNNHYGGRRYGTSKKDWKLFREKISTWQESYMETLIEEYFEILRDDLPASSRFWKLEDRIKRDKHKKATFKLFD